MADEPAGAGTSALDLAALDLAVLAQPVDAGELRGFRSGLERERPFTGGDVLGVLVGLAVAVGLWVFLDRLYAEGGIPFWPIGPLSILLACLPPGIVLTRELRLHRIGSGEREYRIARFARANGMTYRQFLRTPPVRGLVLGQGRERRAESVVQGRSSDGRGFTIANYRFETGRARFPVLRRWGYAETFHGRALPHLLLDARGNNSFFGAGFAKPIEGDQRIYAVGEFARHFRLFCIEGYEADAQFLFTPQILRRLVADDLELDIEIIDGWLYLYARHDLATVQPERWRFLLETLELLLVRIEQWHAWRETGGTVVEVDGSPVPHASLSLIPPPTRAPQGVHLRHAWPGWAVALWVALLVAAFVTPGIIIAVTGESGR